MSYRPPDTIMIEVTIYQKDMSKEIILPSDMIETENPNAIASRDKYTVANEI